MRLLADKTLGDVVGRGSLSLCAMGIIVISYFVIGFILAIYWFNKEYAESYNDVVINGNAEKGMSSIFLMMLMILWPIKLVRNIIKREVNKL